MLFWIFTGILLIGIIALTIDDVSELGFWFTVIGGISVTVSIFILAWNYIPVDAKVAANEQRYDAIIYEIDSHLYTDEFNLLDTDTLDLARAWNEDLAKYKLLQRNFWIGIYVPNVFDEFEFIDYSSIKTK